MDSESFFKLRNIIPFEWQKKALEKLKKAKRVTLEAPTASGKTLIADFMLANALQIQDDEKKGFCIFITPMRALLNEHKENLIKWLGAYKIEVVNTYSKKLLE